MAGALENKAGLSLKDTFNLYVKAIQRRDLTGLFTTVTSEDHFMFLNVRGELVSTRQDYYVFHERWFEQSDWEMPVDLIEVHEEEDFGYTVAIFHYRGKDPRGTTHAIDSYFTLLFEREDSMWKVVADICTPIRPAAR